MKKIVITGPECTGKTTLTKALAEHYQTHWVPEYAREYLNSLNRKYEEKDLLEIARGQLALEREIERKSNHLLFCDTDLTVIKVWQEYKYGRCFDEVSEIMKSKNYQLHLLMTPDIPWEFDKQRENPDNRKELFDMYKSELDQCKYKYQTISGSFDSRLNAAIKAVDRIT